MSTLQKETMEKIKSLNDEELVLVSNYIENIKNNASEKMYKLLKSFQNDAIYNGTSGMTLDEINNEIYGHN